VSDPL